MRLLHTSDWHFGMSFQSLSYKDDQQYFVDQICEIIKKENVDAVIIAGDVFDRSVAAVEAIELYDDTMNRICGEMKKDVLMVAGNHDGAERLASCSELLKKCGLHIAGVLEKEPYKVSYEDVEVYLLPWITTTQAKAVFADQADAMDSLEAAYKVACDRMREDFDKDKKHILVSHSFMTKAEVSESDRAAVVGNAAQIGSACFDGFDYVALGHIHKPQDVTDKIRYSGTPMAYSFGKEEKQTKSVTIIDTDTMERNIIPIKPLHKRTTLTGTYDELLALDCDEETRTGYVKVEVTDTVMTINTYSRLKEKYPNLLEASGKIDYEDSGNITMTMEDLQEHENDPIAIFKLYCKDNEFDVDEEIEDMFKKAVDMYNEEVDL